MATITPPAYWQIGKTLPESFDHIFTSGIASDVTFLVGEEERRIPAHKQVLISRSPVFFAMLEGLMAEKREISIPDISEETFMLFLRYLYTDTINLTARNVVPVFNAARKYCVDILVSLCEEFITKNLTFDNVCAFLAEAHVFKADSLQEECLRFISECPKAVLQSAAFTDLCLSCVTRITGNDDLHVDESNVYEALIRWAEAECARRKVEATAENKREFLGETLYTVRYLHVDENFLLGQICFDKILKPEDIDEIVNYNRNQKTLVSEKLYTTKRMGITQRFHRDEFVVSGHWSTKPVTEAISFRSSSDVYLYGFGSFHAEAEPGSVDLKVFEEDACLVHATNVAVAPSLPGKQNMGDVLLDTPIKIHAEKTYTIVECPNSIIYHHLHSGGLTKVTHQHVTIEFSSSAQDESSTSMAQIPYLILNI